MFNKRPLTLLCSMPALLLVPLLLRAQDKTELQQILERLDHLEQENHQLADEVHALRTELAARGQTTTQQSAQAQGSQSTSPAPPPATAAPLEERVPVVEQRVADLSQEKVEASQRFPISLT